MQTDLPRGKCAALSATEIKRFAILPRDFSMAEGELTPTLKLKRRVCEEHFAAELEALYS
jgi:long-chain acyl-CoA synthetase